MKFFVGLPEVVFDAHARRTLENVLTAVSGLSVLARGARYTDEEKEGLLDAVETITSVIDQLLIPAGTQSDINETRQ